MDMIGFVFFFFFSEPRSPPCILGILILTQGYPERHTLLKKQHSLHCYAKHKEGYMKWKLSSKAPGGRFLDPASCYRFSITTITRTGTKEV